jgi:hypothetical protein
MKKVLSLAVTSLLLLSVFAPPAIAALPKAGAKCSTLGQSVIASGKKFTCLKVGSKQVWNKGVKVASSSGSTPKTSTFKAKIPITLPAVQNGQITFQNIVSNFALIPEVAFKNSQDVQLKNSVPNISVDIFVGPNTKLDFPGGESQIKDTLLATAKLWSGFSQSEVVTIVAYNAEDVTWAEQKMIDVGIKRNYSKLLDHSRAIRGNCQQQIAPGQFTGTISSCGGSNAGSFLDSPDSFIQFGMTGKNTDLYFSSGALVGHEYTHTVQSAHWINDPKCKNIDGKHCFRSGMANQGFSPCWLFEGLPNSSGRMAVAKSLDQYKSYRSGLPYGWGPTTITDYKEESLKNYLFNQIPSTCYQNGDLYKLGYSVGALTSEALIAIGGPQSVMALYALGAEGQDFPTAFKNVYGISWSEGSTILSKVLAAEYATFGAPPR